jgi:hypothetical protein
VKALNSDETVLEEDVFHDGEGFCGIIRARAEIAIVRILAKTNAGDSTGNTSFYLDDLAFGRGTQSRLLGPLPRRSCQPWEHPTIKDNVLTRQVTCVNTAKERSESTKLLCRAKTTRRN